MVNGKMAGRESKIHGNTEGCHGFQGWKLKSLYEQG